MSDMEYCPVCLTKKLVECKCLGIQTYELSCYPDEYKLVPVHPTNDGQHWYKREDVERLLRERSEANPNKEEIASRLSRALINAFNQTGDVPSEQDLKDAAAYVLNTNP